MHPSSDFYIYAISVYLEEYSNETNVKYRHSKLIELIELIEQILWNIYWLQKRIREKDALFGFAMGLIALLLIAKPKKDNKTLIDLTYKLDNRL